jgi:hypothetical protein
MMRQPAHCKYTPFEVYLREIPVHQNTLTLSFEQVERAMNNPLPKSAYGRLTWWSNEIHTGLSHKNAWLNTGWNVESVDLAGKRVQFIRAKDDR